MGIFEDQAKLAQDRAARRDLPGALEAIDRAAVEAIRVLAFRARLLDALGRPVEALDAMRCIDAMPSAPDTAPVRDLEFRADLEMRLTRIDAALATLGRMLDMPGLSAADRARAHARRADAWRVLGDFDRAVADLDAALALRPREGELHRLRGELVAARAGDGMVARLEQARASVPDDSRDAVHLDFALARALDEAGDHPASAAVLTRANAGMRRRYPYDIRKRLSLVEAVCAAFADVTPATVRPERAEGGASDFAPIFITGLPRSGTTLIEQILSAHPDVGAAGEAGIFNPAAMSVIGSPEAPPPGGLDLSDAALARLGHLYARRMRARHGPAPRHTDKSLQTLLVAGPALAALPRARLIVLRRDPRATALSIYRQVFRDGAQRFSYDLDDIRAYQDSFERLTGFWSDRLQDRFHVVDYEDVVTRPEPAIRALLDRVGLPFHPACLAPQDSRRPVTTLSAVAVRKPITADALRAWEPYRALLGLDRFLR